MTTKPSGAAKRPYGITGSSRRSIYTDPATWAYLKEIGAGNASCGVRKAVAAHKKQESRDE